MNLFQRLKHDLRAGLAAMRYGTVRAATRALEETERLSVRLEVRKIDVKLADVCRDIGERALELHGRAEPAADILDDPEIQRRLEQARALKLQRTKILTEVEAGEPE
jgi:alkylation response protein AidB-like acyl-CoA dehydrogenase